MVGKGRRALDAIVQESAITESSPRRELITRPVTATKSPRSTRAFHCARGSSPTFALESMTCRRVPSPSWRVPKHSLPVLRTCTTRPATVTMCSVSWPDSRWPNCSRTSARVAVRFTPTGYGAIPASEAAWRFSARTSIWSLSSCALSSGSELGDAAGTVVSGCSVTVDQDTVHAGIRMLSISRVGPTHAATSASAPGRGSVTASVSGSTVTR